MKTLYERTSPYLSKTRYEVPGERLFICDAVLKAADDAVKTYYYVLLLRPLRLLGAPDFKTAQDLQYIAGPIYAVDEVEAAKLAKTELAHADKDKSIKEATVLGHIAGGLYKPWFNGEFR